MTERASTDVSGAVGPNELARDFVVGALAAEDLPADATMLKKWRREERRDTSCDSTETGGGKLLRGVA